MSVLVGVCATLTFTPNATADEMQPQFKRVRTQFIAALGAPDANSGNGAQEWGLWPVDPGPRGVPLNRYDRLQADGFVARAGWRFDPGEWWLEEYGRIMEKPQFPLPPGQYLVTGDRAVTTTLTVYPADENGEQRWELGDDATLYDVTHLGCRSARYVPTGGPGSCTPADAPQDAFRVAPGAEMPPVEGCSKQDYAVVFVIGVAEQGAG
jgi:hypothetical protein